MNLFVYGTLMVPRLMRAITGCRFSHACAILKGYARYGVRNAIYPGLIPEQAASTTGLVYSDMDARSGRLLDAFEGGEYRRQEVTVEVAGAGVVLAETYVFKPAFRHLLSDADWDLEEFRNIHIETYLRRFKR